MSELDAGLSSTANVTPQADSPTIDSVLDTAFEPSPEPAASSDPSASTEPAVEPVAATSQPQEPAKPELGVKGEPPRERWDSILANARTKARDEALAEHKDALEIITRLRSDLGGTLEQLIDEASADDRYSARIVAKAAALLNARKGQAKADSEPEPDLQLQDGTLAYSADQSRKLQEWNNRQIEKRLGEQFKPLQELQTQFTQTKEAQRQAKEAFTIATKRGAQWKTMPFFEDHKAAILERQQAIYTEMSAAGQIDPVQAPWDALQRAYAEVVTANALPKLQTQQTDSLVASAARKRAASSSDPGAAAPAQPRKPRTIDEALDQVFSAHQSA